MRHRNSPIVVKDGEKKLIILADNPWLTSYCDGKHVIETYDPAENSDHDCDAMGCGQEHVKSRRPATPEEVELWKTLWDLQKV